VTTGPDDPASSRDHVRAAHADRDAVIEALKTAFVAGRLSKTELTTRTAQALAGRTYADLAALTADIPAESPAAPSPDRPPVPEVSRPVAKAAAISGMCLIIAAAAVEIGAHIDPNVPGPNPHHAWVAASFCLALGAVIIAAFTAFLGVAVAIQQRHSRGFPAAP